MIKVMASTVLYMSSSFWLLGVDSCNFSHDEKERTACRADQIHKMTTIFTQNGPRLSFWMKSVSHFVNLLSFTSSYFILSLRKITWLNSQQPKTRGHVEHLRHNCLIYILCKFKAYFRFRNGRKYVRKTPSRLYVNWTHTGYGIYDLSLCRQC